MAYDHGDQGSPRRRSRLGECFSCCFGGGGGGGGGVGGEGYEPPQESQTASFVRSSSTWIRSKAQEIPEIKEKCRGLISRMAKPRRQSGDFRYDPLSYALNFDEGPDFDGDGGEISPAEFRYRNFSSRLPPTPPHLIPAESAPGKGMIACN